MTQGNEPVYPIWFEGSLGQMNSTGGLSKRELFAINIFSQLIAYWGSGHEVKAAQESVSAADLLIIELNK